MNKKYLIIGVVILVGGFLAYKWYQSQKKKQAEQKMVSDLPTKETLSKITKAQGSSTAIKTTTPVSTAKGTGTTVSGIATKVLPKPTPIQQQTKAQNLVKKEVVFTQPVQKYPNVAQTVQGSKGTQLYKTSLKIE